MQSPLVSIIIPSYNYGSFISQTLDNLLAQSYQNWEAIIIDDGSTDDTGEVVDVYLKKDTRFIYIYQSNRGPSSARNNGLKHAKGDYVCFLDADDFFSKDKITSQVCFMEEYKDCDISYTSYYYFKDRKIDELFRDFFLTEKIKESMPKINVRGQAVLPYLVRGLLLTVNAALLRRGFLLSHELYFDENYRLYEDRDFWLRCAYNNALFSYLDNQEAYVMIRVHPTSSSQNRKQMNHYETMVRLGIKAYIAQHPQVKYLEKLNDKYLNVLLYRDILWNNNRLSYRGFRKILKQIGWFNSIQFTIKELNRARKNR